MAWHNSNQRKRSNNQSQEHTAKKQLEAGIFEEQQLFVLKAKSCYKYPTSLIVPTRPSQLVKLAATEACKFLLYVQSRQAGQLDRATNLPVPTLILHTYLCHCWIPPLLLLPSAAVQPYRHKEAHFMQQFK